MIYVFQDKKEIPDSWFKKVAKLQKKLDDAKTIKDRKEIVKKNNIWGDIKPQLLKMSHGKCWYSEANDAVSDWHVDHFRPKGNAIGYDGKVREGYLWLAFDWTNYRIAGSYPNSPHKDEEGTTKGKWDHFPLFDDTKAASWENQDCKDEICLILDPTDKSDPTLIGFKQDGMPEATTNIGVTEIRVERTVHLLNLDSPRLVEARKKAWRDTEDLIEELIEASPKNFNDVSEYDFNRVKRITEKIAKRTEPSHPYASTIRCCLQKNNYSGLIRATEHAQMA